MNAVIVLRIKLGLLHRLRAASRASFVIGKCRGLAIEIPDDGLRGARHKMDRGVAPVTQGDRILDPGQRLADRAAGAADMAGISVGGGEAAGGGAGQRGVIDRATEAARAEALETAIPVGDGQPNLDAHLLARPGAYGRNDAADRDAERDRRAAARWCEGTGGERLRCGDLGVGDGGRCEALAITSGGRMRRARQHGRGKQGDCGRDAGSDQLTRGA